jgi:dipeptidyl aminopeptidase/acylaminoacyl peptidase
MKTFRSTPAAVLGALLATGCDSPGGEGTPLGGTTVVPELLVCRSRVDNTIGFSEIALRTAQNLGTGRVGDRTGIERRARLHPDGTTVVFARERFADDPGSRELYTSTIDGSHAELRLTIDEARDDEPCWSPDGSRILFASERGGDRGLWLCAANGSDVQRFLMPPAGGGDGAPDWSPATGRVAFVRADANGPARLWLAQGDGSGAIPFTDGAAAGPGFGDGDPAFAPDGSRVVFARRLPAGASLCAADVATGTVAVLTTTTGEVGLPRYTPQADRVFFGLAEPDAGRLPLRLCVVPAAGGSPELVWPDERYRLEGIDLLPAMPPAPAAGPPQLLDVTAAEVGIAWGRSLGVQSVAALTAADGYELHVGTLATSHREVAGIEVDFGLPVDDPFDVLAVRVRVVARVDRTGGDSVLRLSLYNPVDERFDTVVELGPQSTAAATLTFATSSLRHVTRERGFRFHVIGDLPAGDPSELHVDHVEVELVTVAN